MSSQAGDARDPGAVSDLAFPVVSGGQGGCGDLEDRFPHVLVTVMSAGAGRGQGDRGGLRMGTHQLDIRTSSIQYVSMSASGAKREYILITAATVFGRYGYKRTSMDMLAQAAGMSRPALYQHFSGKRDIFNAMCSLMFNNVLDAGVEAVRAEGSVAERLYNLLSIKLDLVIGSVEAEFRGEMLSEVSLFAGDVLGSFQEQFTVIIESLLVSSTDELNLINVEMSARDCANLLLDAVVGITHSGAEPNIQHRRLRQLVDLTVRGVGHPLFCAHDR
jgi:AcrR family transcriptional regulator